MNGIKKYYDPQKTEHVKLRSISCGATIETIVMRVHQEFQLKGSAIRVNFRLFTKLSPLSYQLYQKVCSLRFALVEVRTRLARSCYRAAWPVREERSRMQMIRLRASSGDAKCFACFVLFGVACLRSEIDFFLRQKKTKGEGQR